ncbi:hypothetical protein VPH35_138029 [Triticum aestivum]
MKGTSNPLERGYLEKSIAFRPFNAVKIKHEPFVSLVLPSRPIPIYLPWTVPEEDQSQPALALHMIAYLSFSCSRPPRSTPFPLSPSSGTSSSSSPSPSACTSNRGWEL